MKPYLIRFPTNRSRRREEADFREPKLHPPPYLDGYEDNEMSAPGRAPCAPWRRCNTAILALGLLTSFLPSLLQAASFQQDANGFVVMEAENFDLNVTRSDGAWIFDSAPLGGLDDPYSGPGYMKAFSTGGTNAAIHPHADFKINFTTTGPHYVWVLGSDAGGKSLHLGLDGIVPNTAFDIGGPDGAFGARFGGELWWVGTNNNPVLGMNYTSKAYLDVLSTGEHTVNLFIRAQGMYVDKIMLTTNIDFTPDPLFGGINGGLNVPGETVVPAASLSVAITQPAGGQEFSSNSPVTIVAKPASPGPAINKVEFFAKLLPSGSNTKIGEATSALYILEWTDHLAGTYALTAKVTDALNGTATSPEIQVIIKIPSTFLTPLVCVTNDFEDGPGDFTLEFMNHAGGFNFGWANSSYAGGTPGEIGGFIVRRADIGPYMAVPLARDVTRNEPLWFRGTMMLSNISANNDTFIGYFNRNSAGQPPRVGLKIREPTSAGGVWRFRAVPEELGNLAMTLPSATPATFEIAWVPSGFTNGSGTLTGMVAGVSFGPLAMTAPNVDVFNTFGLLAVTQGDTDTNKQSFIWLDDMAYKAPMPFTLSAELISPSRVLLSWKVPNAILERNDVSVAGSANWVNAGFPVIPVGDTFYSTNVIGPSMRWFRLKGQ